jgi:hypothetical protein
MILVEVRRGVRKPLVPYDYCRVCSCPEGGSQGRLGNFRPMTRLASWLSRADLAQAPAPPSATHEALNLQEATRADP